MGTDTVKDSLEGVAQHFVTLYQGMIVAAGRLHQNTPDQYQIRYMATHSKYQRQKLGSQLLSFIEQEAIKIGAKEIILNARSKAIAFYKSNNYKPIGKPHIEIDLEHQKMIKRFD